MRDLQQCLDDVCGNNECTLSVELITRKRSSRHNIIKHCKSFTVT